MLAIESLSREPLVLDDVVTERGVETHSWDHGMDGCKMCVTLEAAIYALAGEIATVLHPHFVRRSSLVENRLTSTDANLKARGDSE